MDMAMELLTNPIVQGIAIKGAVSAYKKYALKLDDVTLSSPQLVGVHAAILILSFITTSLTLFVDHKAEQIDVSSALNFIMIYASALATHAIAKDVVTVKNAHK